LLRKEASFRGAGTCFDIVLLRGELRFQGKIVEFLSGWLAVATDYTVS